MGLFQQRPEEPTEWGGLPAEPWEPGGPAETLAETSTFDIPLFGEIPRRESIAYTAAPPEDEPGEAPSATAGADDGD